MTTLIRLEITRAVRNRKFLFFSVVYPAVLFLLIAGTSGTSDKVPGTGLSTVMFMMVAMASFGALTAVLMGNSERIAKEREKGWVRQLRLTSLPGRGYVAAKIASAAVVSLPSIVIVFVVAATVKDVHLQAAWQWFALIAGDLGGQQRLRRAGRGHRLPRHRRRGPADLHDLLLRAVGPGRPVDARHATSPSGCRTSPTTCPPMPYAGLGQSIEFGGAPRAEDVACSSPILCSSPAPPRGCTARTPARHERDGAGVSVSRTRRLVERHLVGDGGARPGRPRRRPAAERSAVGDGEAAVGGHLARLPERRRSTTCATAATATGRSWPAPSVWRSSSAATWALVFRNTSRTGTLVGTGLPMAVLVLLALLLPLAFGPPWLVLFVYVSVGFGAVLPARTASAAVPVAAAALAAVGAALGGRRRPASRRC